MSRLMTCGAEIGSPGSTFTLLAEDAGFTDAYGAGSATATVATDNVRSGANSLKFANASGSGTLWQWTWTAVATRTYFARFAVYVNTHDSTNGEYIGGIYEATGFNGTALLINAAGVLQLAEQTSPSTILVTGPTLSTGTWYVIEHSLNLNTGAVQLLVNERSYGTGTGTTSANTNYRFEFGVASISVNPVATVTFDDLAVNDDQGTAQNSWPGMGQVVLLKPASDNARTGFTAGAGGTSNLYAAVDTVPPAGVALASATNTSQIKDATSNTTDNYKPNLQTYVAAGIPASAALVLAQGVARHGNSSTTSRTNGVQVTSNPVIAETTGATGTTAAATEPTGWTTLKTAVSYSPAAVLTSAPVMEFRKATASSNSSMADFMGLYVEYVSQPVPQWRDPDTNSRRGLAPRRGQQATPVPAQVITSPSYPLPNRAPALRKMAARRTGRTAPPVPAWFPTTPILDPLTGRPPENPLSYYGAWVSVAGQGPLNSQVMALSATGATIPTSSSNGYANSAWYAPFALPIEVYSTFATAPSTGADSDAGYVMWLSSPTSATATGYFCWAGFDSGGLSYISVERQDASGAQTTLKTVTLPYTLAAGDSWGMSISVASIITLWFKRGAGQWTAVGSVTDTTYTGTGYLVTAAYSAGLLQQPVMTNFGGGTSYSKLQFQPNPAPNRSLAGRRVPATRRGRTQTYIPTQATVTAPVYPVPRLGARRAIGALRPGRQASPVPEQIPVPNPAWPNRAPATMRRSFAIDPHGRRTFVVPPQIPVPPTIPPNRAPAGRRIAALIHGRRTFPAQPQDSAPVERRTRPVATLIRRGQRVSPVPAQIPVPPTIPGNRVTSEARRLFFLAPRGRVRQPVQVQQAVIPSTVPGYRAPAGRRIAARVRGARTVVVPAQIPVPSPVWPTRVSSTRRRLFAVQPHGRRSWPTPPQVPVPLLTPAIRVELRARKLAAAIHGRRTAPVHGNLTPVGARPTRHRLPAIIWPTRTDVVHEPVAPPPPRFVSARPQPSRSFLTGLRNRAHRWEVLTSIRPAVTGIIRAVLAGDTPSAFTAAGDSPAVFSVAGDTADVDSTTGDTLWETNQ